ncbi:hypothetical protein [Acinetobacter pittii]|uniref:hypothetical protein n=1 Tax=Acinetobacter pittii TaxID=48296 RepID=UPI0008388B7B|nr:hypothetical protein [Acinetobacter pittii]MCK0915103.1 hypothetical protein [Acinetobacter pittii]
MKLSVRGFLVAAITVMVEGKAIECKEVEVSDLTTGELFDARSQAKADEYIAIKELAVKTTLIDSNENTYPLTYELLRDTSSSNFNKLQELDQELQKKLSAGSLETLST